MATSLNGFAAMRIVNSTHYAATINLANSAKGSTQTALSAT
jgi:hypothetical protein